MKDDRFRIVKRRGNRIRHVHRVISWLLVLFSAWTIYTGYAAARVWTENVEKMTSSHLKIECFFILFLVIHIVLTSIYFRVDLSKVIRGVLNRKGFRVQLLRLIQNVTAWLIIVTAFFVILSGMIVPDLAALQMEGTDPWELHKFYDIFLTLVIVIHSAVGLRFYMMRRRTNAHYSDILSIALCILLIIIVLYIG